jgi:FlaA1/EpsC-like NDP-sugar epimerase
MSFTDNILPYIGRSHELLADDISARSKQLYDAVSNSSFLVLGGAGTIGQAVVKEIFKRQPKKLHVIDINENNLVELVRDVRSSYGYISGEFKSLALDVGSVEYDAFIKSDGKYDYVLNLSALKHVRSEKDPFTLMRMIDVNILNTEKTVQQSIDNGVKKYFCVSTDKAANPVNMMGASKRIMEMFLMRRSGDIDISMARFANVAFSDGSLLHGFSQRLLKNQPIVAPDDVKRYFITPKESGEICLMSTILGRTRDIFFPKLTEDLNLVSFSDIAYKYIENNGYKPKLCSTEDEARELVKTLPMQGEWPCLFSTSDTTGEKYIEEFYTGNEVLDMELFKNLGVIKYEAIYDEILLSEFSETIVSMKQKKEWSKKSIVELFHRMIPEFKHKETGKYLDGKM